MTTGTRLAQQGVIVVTINHRQRRWVIGVAGLERGDAGAFPAITDCSIRSKRCAGFSAISARLAATTHVTIAGESAGALSVMYLMATPFARGLFSKAISQNGYMVIGAELRRGVPGFPAAESIGACGWRPVCTRAASKICAR